eukprot:GHUV01057204.1.p1 GENE.GHUV01057204.1~~GHUV01057204.1.p1  ORF type:complete len:670 (+),score=222.28 GHUV01057204.1:746-2755(+)
MLLVCLCRVRSQEDARDTFKTLKNQLVGDGSARLYFEWASLEHEAGNVSKALGIIAKGLRSGAQPARYVHRVTSFSATLAVGCVANVASSSVPPCCRCSAAPVVLATGSDSFPACFSCSLLEQLRVEMQSGTFDFKNAGSYTETLTIDASSAAARQLQQPATTPAPPPTALTAAGASTASMRPATASCLKGHYVAPSSISNGLVPEHGARAVSFAADVLDPARAHEDYSKRPGSAGMYSTRGVPRTADSHSGCLSTSSTSSRSTTSVHDGTLPFSSGAVSYKSSTTESSSVGGVEEDTISCQAAGAAQGTADKDGGSKPSTAPLSCQPTPGPGASASNTATIGLKRFGFKSRALRVGGAADGPTRITQPTPETAGASTDAVKTAMPPPARPEPAAHIATSTATASHSDDDAAAGRKRRAGEVSLSARNTSPKLGEVQDSRAQFSAAEPRSLAPSTQKAAIAAVEAAGHDSHQVLATACRSSCSEEDSVPLVSSKLAARLAQGTPLAAGRPADKDIGWSGIGATTPPAEGQVPSSLDNTPEPNVLDVTLSRSAAGSSSQRQSQEPWDCHAAAGPCSQQPPGLVPGSSSRADSRGQAAAEAVMEQPLPTMVLPDVSAAPRQPSRQPTSSRNSEQQGRQQTQQQQVVQQAAQHVQQQPQRSAVTVTARTPLR